MSDSFAFLSPAAVRATDGHRPLLRTPVERSHIAAGATIEEAGGWRIARYDAEPGEAWLADVSHTGKLDVRGDAARVDELTGGADLGAASHHDGVWTLRISPTHAAVICPFERVTDLSERIGAGVDRHDVRLGRRSRSAVPPCATCSCARRAWTSARAGSRPGAAWPAR